MSIEKSQELFEKAKIVIPGGVNSPVRAFTQVGGTPRFIERGEGCYLYDIDGNSYVDFICSWGPLILGHRSQLQIDAIQKALEIGTGFGAPTSLEVEFAELICGLIPGMDMIRLVSSGTEATMSAARLARGYTGRPYIVKCNGCYHGHSDSFLVQAGSGAATQGISGSLGVSDKVVSETISIEFNDIEILKASLEKIGYDNCAAIILEPVPGNMGLVLPQEGYLHAVRELCNAYGILLLFDEVMSGFRVSLTGAAGYFNVTPDIYCFGKVIGGGLPMAAYGGRKEIMSTMAPLGGVYQAGTLSGNPVAVSVGLATVKFLIENNPYAILEERGKTLMDGMKSIFIKEGIPFQANVCGSMFGFFFSETPVTNYTQAKNTHIEVFKKFFHEMLCEGVYFAPSAFEAGFLCIHHTGDVIDSVLEKVKRVASRLCF